MALLLERYITRELFYFSTFHWFYCKITSICTAESTAVGIIADVHLQQITDWVIHCINRGKTPHIEMQEVVKSALIRHLLSEVIRRPHNRHLRSQKLLLSKVTIVSGKSFGTLYFFLMFSTFATTSPPPPHLTVAWCWSWWRSCLRRDRERDFLVTY